MIMAQMRTFDQFFNLEGTLLPVSERTLEHLLPAIKHQSEGSGARPITTDDDLNQEIESIGNILEVLDSKKAVHFLKNSDGHMPGITFDRSSYLIHVIDTVYLYADGNVKDGNGQEIAINDLNTLYDKAQIVTYTADPSH